MRSLDSPADTTRPAKNVVGVAVGEAVGEVVGERVGPPVRTAKRKAIDTVSDRVIIQSH